jgi:hypothetical protein
VEDDSSSDHALFDDLMLFEKERHQQVYKLVTLAASVH